MSNPSPSEPTDLELKLDTDEARAILVDSIDLCGCCETGAVAAQVLEFLRWASRIQDTNPERPSYSALFNGNIGVYYLIHTLMDDADLVEHGTSCRCPWLTEKGQELMAKLEALAHA